MAIMYVGIGLAKNMFAVHEVAEHGQSTLARSKVARGLARAVVARLTTLVSRHMEMA
ncbi:MAG: hypothetical protein IPK63_12920 [Candidatus Competibacteraceae bacterium]|nr:hypothetical protein [Candidatus Competibacteraceae bacterium]